MGVLIKSASIGVQFFFKIIQKERMRLNTHYNIIAEPCVDLKLGITFRLEIKIMRFYISTKNLLTSSIYQSMTSPTWSRSPNNTMSICLCRWFWTSWWLIGCLNLEEFLAWFVQIQLDHPQPITKCIKNKRKVNIAVCDCLVVDPDKYCVKSEEILSRTTWNGSASTTVGLQLLPITSLVYNINNSILVPGSVQFYHKGFSSHYWFTLRLQILASFLQFPPP